MNDKIQTIKTRVANIVKYIFNRNKVERKPLHVVNFCCKYCKRSMRLYRLGDEDDAEICKVPICKCCGDLFYCICAFCKNSFDSEFQDTKTHRSKK